MFSALLFELTVHGSLIKVAVSSFGPDPHTFGFATDAEVENEFRQCMFDGEISSMCDVLCMQDSSDDLISEANEGTRENKCDQCRGKDEQVLRII